MCDEVDQSVAWKVRLTTALIGQQFDDETLAEMLYAGLSKAHSEGLQDAAYVCQKVADKTKHPVSSVATVLARQIRALDKLNNGGADGQAPRK